jgi:hypothetical protein
MMDCSRFRDMADLLAAGEVEGAEAVECRAHAKACAECGRLLEEARATAARVGEALRAMEPGDGLDEEIMNRLERAAGTVPARRRSAAGRVSWLRIAGYAAAAAAIVVAVVFFSPRGKRRDVLFGQLAGGTGSLQGDDRYSTLEDTGIELESGARVLLTARSSFSVEDSRLRLHTGRCYVATNEGVSDTRIVTRLTAEGLYAELGGGAEAFLYSGVDEGGETGDDGFVEAILGALMPGAYADGPPDHAPLLLVFAGSSRVTCGGRELVVVAGQGIFADSTSDGPFDTTKLTARYEAEIAKARAMIGSLSERMALYGRVVASYDKTLRERKERRRNLLALRSLTEAEKAELAETENRIRIVADAKQAHEKRIFEWKLVLEDERKARITDIEHRLDVMKRAASNHRAAIDGLMQ